MNPYIYFQEFFDVLRNYPKYPGNFVRVEKTQLKNHLTDGGYETGQLPL
jgi:hypothetical protein